MNSEYSSKLALFLWRNNAGNTNQKTLLTTVGGCGGGGGKFIFDGVSLLHVYYTLRRLPVSHPLSYNDILGYISAVLVQTRN